MNDKQIKRAVALKYDQAKSMTPRVVAKGKGHIAEQIMQVARKNDVPFHEDPTWPTCWRPWNWSLKFPLNFTGPLPKCWCSFTGSMASYRR